tara:strand:+ start:10157 stop:10873 length:717 start_codon:yes stop_codon:yes gene_type:complete
MKKIIQLFIIVFFTLIFYQCNNDDENIVEQTAETVTDINGNVYRTITIGNQTWMAENLKTTSFNDGISMTKFTFGENWNKDGQTFPFYTWADTSDLNNVYDEELPEEFYGAIYNEAAIVSGKLAPNGWRIPTLQDWMELKNFTSNDGNTGNEGTALKSSTGWISFSGNGTDLYEFNGLANGYTNNFGGATGAESIATWATTESDEINKIRKVATLFKTTLEFGDNSTLLGSGIRCIKE